MKRFELKVPGGKLIRVKIEVESEKIRFIQFTGDFFMQPENNLEELEALLIGCPTDVAKIESMVKEFFSKKMTLIAGASPADFAFVIVKAIET